MGPIDVAYVGVGVSLLLVTFDLCSAPSTLTLAHPNPSPLVNELEDPGAITGSVWLKESLSACEGLVIVWRWCCSTHPGIVCVLMLLRLCCLSGNVLVVSVKFQWASLRNRMVLFWLCPGPSLLT